MQKKVSGRQVKRMEGKCDLCVKSLLFKAGMEIKQNYTVPGKTWDSKEWLIYLC